MKSELKTDKMTNVKQSHKIICLQVGSDIEIFRMVYTDIQWSKNSSLWIFDFSHMTYKPILTSYQKMEKTELVLTQINSQNAQNNYCVDEWSVS